MPLPKWASAASMATAALTGGALVFVPSATLPRTLTNTGTGMAMFEGQSHDDKTTSQSRPVSMSSLGLLAGVAGSALLVAQRGSKRSSAEINKGRVAVHAFENELGVQPPVGFWDPLGFCDDGDEFEFRRRRCVEIKHGRVSMLACIGYIVPEYFKWPGYLSPSTNLKFADVPHGLAAITKVPAVGWQQIVFFCLAMELFAAYQPPDKPPGSLSTRLVFALTEVKTGLNNYEWGPFGIPNAPKIADPEVRKRKLNAEIANGRLAMFAIMAMMFQNGTVGTTGPEMWLPAA